MSPESLRSPKDIMIGERTLEEILKNHEDWVKMGCPESKNNMRANLYGADLEGTDLSGANLFNADLGEARLSYCDLSGANLRKANLDGALMHDCDLCQADMSESSMYKVDLRDSNLTKSDLTGTRLQSSCLDHAVFQKANLLGADLRDTSICDAVLCEAVLCNADLSGSTLEKSELMDADLSYANLAGTKLYEDDMTRADLHGACLNKVHVHETVFCEADLSGAVLSYSWIDNGDFKDANLQSCDSKCNSFEWDKLGPDPSEEACLKQESDKVRRFSSSDVFCLFSFESEKYGTVPCTVTYDQQAKNIMIAFADGGDDVSAKKIMMDIFGTDVFKYGDEACGSDWIGHTPPKAEFSEECAVHVAEYVEAEYLSHKARGEDGRISDIGKSIEAMKIKSDIIKKIRQSEPYFAEKGFVSPVRDADDKKSLR